MITTWDAAEFVAHPLGQCLVGDGFVIWCAAEDLAGTIHWGVIDDRCVRAMLEAQGFIRHPALAASGRILMDFREIERVDTEALLRFTETAEGSLPTWSPRLERQVVALPEGLAGVLIAGALPSLAPTHAIRFAHDLEEAVELVDHPATRTAHAAAAAIATAARGNSLLVARLRAHLARQLTDATVDGAAGALGLSERTLQRELRELGTSFSDELRRIRVSAAEDLLLHTDLKVDVIAAQVGLGTGSRMNATLRRERNATATVLRGRARKA